MFKSEDNKKGVVRVYWQVVRARVAKVDATLASIYLRTLVTPQSLLDHPQAIQQSAQRSHGKPHASLLPAQVLALCTHSQHA